MKNLNSILSDPISGSFSIPGDKSISHRAVIFSSISRGTSEIKNLLEGDDVLATIAAFQMMGVTIDRICDGEYLIYGEGIKSLKRSSNAINLGNSGTAIRLLAGLLSAMPFSSVLIGDSSLSKRPMKRVTEPLLTMGADIKTTNGAPPIYINKVEKLIGINYEMPVNSAQVKSAILLAGLFAEGTTRIIEPVKTRDHTERMLASFTDTNLTQSDHIKVEGGLALNAQKILIPGDISSAAFFLVAATIVKKSDILIRNVGINETRSAIIDILLEMGANIEIRNQTIVCNEPVCDIRVRSSNLKGINISQSKTANAIDEFPIIAIAAACATGETHIRGAQELRYKESDRIASMVDGLKQVGISVSEHNDGMDIVGGQIGSGIVNSYGDHRIAMAFAVAGCVSEGGITIRDCENISTSFPSFMFTAERHGFNISVV